MIALILPIYNEELEIEHVFSNIQTVMKDYIGVSQLQVILVDDGSTDASAEVIKNIADKNTYVSAKYLPKNRGKGFAIMTGLASVDSRAEIAGFLDADRDIDISILNVMIDSIQNGGFNLAIGSKYLPSSKVSAPFFRRVLSRVFRVLTRFILKINVSDTQTGIKLFDQEFLILCNGNSFSVSSFSFDLELLTLASRNSMSISEHPVTITKSFGSNVGFKNGFNALRDVLLLAIRYK